jgi:hypothetical protein
MAAFAPGALSANDFHRVTPFAAWTERFFRGHKDWYSNATSAVLSSNANEKNAAPFRKCPDFLMRGGVYGKSNWSASILPSKLGNGKKRWWLTQKNN